MTGIEPASPAWEAGVLPMNYICVWIDYSISKRKIKRFFISKPFCILWKRLGKQTATFQLTTYTDWKNPTISEIKVADRKLTIGVHISTNAASWGTVNDFALYKIAD